MPACTSPTLLPPSPHTVLSLSCFKVLQCINCCDWHCKSFKISSISGLVYVYSICYLAVRKSAVGLCFQAEDKGEKLFVADRDPPILVGVVSAERLGEGL